MPIQVKYFGAIEEATGKKEEAFEVSDIRGSLDRLKTACHEKYPSLNELTFQLAVNQSLESGDQLKDGDEVAFLPPFAGG